jgi:hypothetical protein
MPAATALEFGMVAADNQVAAMVDANSQRFISPSLNDAMDLPSSHAVERPHQPAGKQANVRRI